MKTIINFSKLFSSGMTSLFSPINTRKARFNRILQKSDVEALRSDWIKTQIDLAKAMNIYEKQSRN